jgi:transcriptional regulator with XRE-family HTH domain
MPAPLSIQSRDHYMAKRTKGLSQEAAAAAAGISLRTAQRIDQGEHQPERGKRRQWRTRQDPLAEVWEEELLPMLETAPALEPQTLLLHLEEHHPEKDWESHKRTLQRRVEQWKSLNGPAKGCISLWR